MGSALAKVKGFFGSDLDSEANTRANTKTNAQPIRVKRSNSLDSPRVPSVVVAESDQSGGLKKQKKITRQVRTPCSIAPSSLQAL